MSDEERQTEIMKMILAALNDFLGGNVQRAINGLQNSVTAMEGLK